MKLDIRMRQEKEIRKKLDWYKDELDEQGGMLGIDLPRFNGIIEALKWVLDEVV